MKLVEKLQIGLRAKLPIVLQSEAAECGLACLLMVARHHGFQGDLGGLRRRYGMSLKGATLKDLIRVADRLGFSARPLRLELDELERLHTPCILHWDLNHFVVLAGVTPTHAVIHDPAIGVRKLKVEDVSRHFTGVALELSPTSSLEPATSPPRIRISQHLGHLKGLRGALGHVLALALAIEVLAMLSPMYLGWVVDQGLVSGDRDLLLVLALGFFLLLLLQTTISALRSWVLMGLNAKLKVGSRGNLFGHLLTLPASFFETRHLGDVMSRFSSQDTILQAITGDLVEAMLDGLMTVITLAVMLFLAPGLATIVVVVAAIYGVLRWASYGPLRNASSEAIIWAARRDSHFLETLRGVRTVKLFNSEADRRLQWLNLQVETINRQIETDKIRIAFKSANRFLLGALKIGVIWLGALKVLDGGFSVGLLFAFLAYMDQFVGRVSEVIDKTADLTLLRLHGERLADIALTPPESDSAPRMGAKLAPGPLSVELRNVSFRYSEHEPWVLRNVSFEILAGESVAIVGPSGGGKTTMFKLIAGFLQPNEGEILVNGAPLARYGVEQFRARVGVVMQDDQLFTGSIAENISFFAERADDELIERCAKLAAVHDDIVAMPMGYGSLIGDMGTVLSGGQKQRVLIARALYRRPSLLLLDEATSHLDVDRERTVNATMRALSVTRIVIAHRPETIRASDRVIELENPATHLNAARRNLRTVRFN